MSWKTSSGIVLQTGLEMKAGADPEWKKKEPEIENILLELAKDDTAGSPVNEEKWIRKSLRNLSEQISEEGFQASPPTVSRLLKKHKYSLMANRKDKEGNSQHPDRNTQFEIIQEKKRECQAANIPRISVDAKNKELIGNFKNKGKALRKEPDIVNVHDFPSDATGPGIPYGVYDPVKNKGFVCVGTSFQTPEFAVESIEIWWKNIGRQDYPNSKELAIFADGGGSNGYRSRLFKKFLQEKLCNNYGLTVSVHHYPRGCSKWNDIEHKMFSFISINWAGVPLRSYGIMLRLIRGTTTKKGLKIEATLNAKVYQKAIKVSDAEFRRIKVERGEICPAWNYVIRPQQLIEANPP